MRVPIREVLKAEEDIKNVTNQELLTNLDRQVPVNPVADNIGPTTIDVENFLANINRASPTTGSTVSAADIAPQRSPITQQGYSGQTFTMPTIAAEGFTFPFQALAKRSAEKRAIQDKQAKEQLAFDYDVAEIKDNIRNGIFIDKQMQHYNDLLETHTDRLGSRRQAIKYLKDNNVLRTSGAKWKNLQGLYDKTFDSYQKVVSDTDALGRSKYDPQTQQLAREFETFIADVDNFDPNNLDEYTKFSNAFNEHVSISELAKQASADLVGIRPENLDEAAENIWAIYGDDQFTQEQKDLFMNSLKYYFKDEIGDFRVKEGIKATNAQNLERLKLEGDITQSEIDAAEAAALEEKRQEGRETLEEKREAGREALEEKKQEGREVIKGMTVAAAAEKAKDLKEGKTTISDQTVSITDPNTGKNVEIEGKSVITFPDKTFPVVPGDSVYVEGVEGVGWITLNEIVDFKPIREFTASIGKVQKKGEIETEDRKLTREERLSVKAGADDPRIKEPADVSEFFNAKDGKQVAYVQAEINIKGTVKKEGEVVQDVVTAKTIDGEDVSLGGKYTVLVPKANVADKLINEFGKDYGVVKVEKKVEPVAKPELSVAAYNADKGKNYTKEQVTTAFGDQYTIVD